MSTEPKIPGMKAMESLDNYITPIPMDFKNEKPWTWIVLHHSYSPDRQKLNDWEAIRKYHTSWRYKDEIVTLNQAKALQAQGKDVIAPWPTCGYHLGLEYDLVNNISSVVYRIGAPLSHVGYHCIGFNEKAIGICFVGNYGGKFDGTDGKIPTDDMLKAGLKLVRFLMFHYKIPKEHVLGHRETYKMLGKTIEKTCPGSHFSIESFRSQLL